MDITSDPISEATPKRRKIKHDYNSEDDSGDELFEELPHQTMPTQLLSRSQLPGSTPTLQPKVQGIFSQVMDNLTAPSANSYTTQPTQPLRRSASPLRSSPSVQVMASSPQTTPHRPQLKRPVASLMAPPGTAYRQPLGIQSRSQRESSEAFNDPPVEISSDEDGDMQASMIKPTNFTKGRTAGRVRETSPVQVDESPKQNSANNFRNGISQYRYDGDLASAYGGQIRKPKPKPDRKSQNAPARAQAVEMTLDDIDDLNLRRKVENMKAVCVDSTITDLFLALEKRHHNYEDALSYVLEQSDELSHHTHPPIIDLASSDVESNVSKPGARPVAKAKQDLKKPTKSIGEKWSSTQAKQDAKVPLRTIQEKYPSNRPSINRSVSSQSESSKPRRRLVKGRRNPSSPAAARSPSPVPIEIESDVESVVQSDKETATHGSLLLFLNRCSAAELADLANEKEDTAVIILSHRPFKTLAAIRKITDGQPTKSGKRSIKRPLGEKVLDVCEEMWEGYEAVDRLVERCEALGRPLADTMKKWGLDLLTADGEIGATKIDEAHDSGIGTPSSSIIMEDDVVSPMKRKTYLKQPGIMSKVLTMKDYQVFGLNWLNLLWSKGLSCILADDMGLGKTCQVISFLAHLKETHVRGTHLVIVPGSTLENWLREFSRFCPDLVVRPYYGSQKEREEQRYDLEEEMKSVDVIVTTYETAAGQKMDNKFLRKHVRPNVCVFDEGHALKNSTTKRHQELMRIPAKFRLLLTGTPLQNNLQELVSLLNFILPEVFTEQSDKLEVIFKYKATTKDADHAALLSTQRIQRARSMMSPFILRRKKQQVLKDIPAKHRRVEFCNMTKTQTVFWEDRVEAARQARLLGPSGRVNNKSNGGHMMSLRLAALHPLLTRKIYTDAKLRKLQQILINNPHSEFYDNREDLMWKYLTADLAGGDYGLHKFCYERQDYIPSEFILKKKEWMDSGKVQALKELLSRFIANGDRVLIFSQFTSMMDILEAVFETLSIKFMRLDGSTKMAQRQDLLDQFTDDTSIPVFMLSTKAGGAGINLACANKVIIFDSSFNPQEDIQAENRAHRVGQTREVEVVRLVTNGTIEELIYKLGESKLALDDRVAGEAGTEDKQAEKEEEKKVEQMFFESLDKGETADAADIEGKIQTDKLKGRTRSKSGDLKDMFKKGLKDAGLDVADK